MSSDECPTQHEIILETGIVVRNLNVFCVLTEVLRAGCSTRRLTHGLTNQRLT